MGALYQISFPNGKSYIGITVQTAAKRFKHHIYDANRKDRKVALHRAINKYGKENCAVRTLVIANDWDYLADLERKAIRRFGTLVPNGYNISAGGDGAFGVRKSEETRRKLSIALKGKQRDPEVGRRHSIVMTGRHHSEETKAKIGSASKGHTLSAEGREKVAATKRGIPRSAETKAKLSAALKGRAVSPVGLEKMRAYSASMRGKSLSAETRARMSAAVFKRYADKKNGC